MDAHTQTMEDLIRRMTPVAAPPEQQAQVAALSKALEGMVHTRKRRAPKCELVGPKGESIPVPESVFYVLERVVEVLARGDSITVVPVGRELTTQQAADRPQLQGDPRQGSSGGSSGFVSHDRGLRRL